VARSHTPCNTKCSGARSFEQIKALSIVAGPEPKLRIVVPDFHFNFPNPCSGDRELFRNPPDEIVNR